MWLYVSPQRATATLMWEFPVTNTSLTIHVNDHCTLDAGCWQECLDEEQRPFRLISPPLTSMYHQLLSYLETATTDWKTPPKSQLHFGEVALATVAVCIRWGSYFAVLVNDDTPQWALADHGAVSCIDDSEMARITIEASAALAEWMSLIHSDPSRFRVLTKAAVSATPFLGFTASWVHVFSPLPGLE